MSRCDRCGKNTWVAARLSGDWRTFCTRCLLAAAWEPPQTSRPRDSAGYAERANQKLEAPR